MMDKMKDMKTKKRTLKKEEKKESETEYVIRAENVDYTYEGSKIKALDHLSLNIRKGKKVAVMGGNGCGKSTFFSLPERDQKTGIRKDFYRWKTDRIYKKRTFRCQTKNRDRISKSG